MFNHGEIVIHNMMNQYDAMKTDNDKDYITTWENVYDLISSRLKLEENCSIRQKLEGNMQ